MASEETTGSALTGTRLTGTLPDGPRAFAGLLSEDPDIPAAGEDPPDPAALSDLHLDQIIDAIADGRPEAGLITGLLERPVRDAATIGYRHEVFRDLEDPGLLQAAEQFAEQMGQVGLHLSQLARMDSARQREGWFLDAAAIYCDAVTALAAALAARPVASRALRAFREYLDDYTASAEFAGLAADTAARKNDLAAILYQVRIDGPHVHVSRYLGEPDYSEEIEETFGRFRQGAVKDYLVRYRTWPGMNHVGAQILELVARLFGEEFSALAAFCDQHAGFADPVISQFNRELDFYLAYLGYIAPMSEAGLPFCYPEVSDSKEVAAQDTFDLALAAKLTRENKTIVSNEFRLAGRERVIVVSGPNQGGKTTFARTFGQLHHLAACGCPVPGSSARLFRADRIFTHFERQEDIGNLTGKLEDDLIRIRGALLTATPRSIVIMNEIFTSTTLSDARFLGEKVMTKVIDLDLLCVYVTFVDELASFGDTVVSMASTVAADNPAERTYKVVRKPADGLAYALAIASKNGVTYSQLRARLHGAGR